MKRGQKKNLPENSWPGTWTIGEGGGKSGRGIPLLDTCAVEAKSTGRGPSTLRHVQQVPKVAAKMATNRGEAWPSKRIGMDEGMAPCRSMKGIG